MSCVNCCYLINASQIKEIIGLQIDSTVTDVAIKTALSMSHDLALDEWIGENCIAYICNLLDEQETNTTPTPEQLIRYEVNDCLVDYLRRYLAYMTISYFTKQNPSARVYGSGIGIRAQNPDTSFEVLADYKKESLANTYGQFAQEWKDKAERYLAREYKNVLFPDFTKIRDFYPCLSDDNECAPRDVMTGSSFTISSL